MADRDVYCGAFGEPLVGTNFQARLLYGTDASSLQPATYTTPARFFNVTTGHSLAGSWRGGTRTLTGFNPGHTLYLQVQAWDSTGGATLEQARAAGLWWAESASFTYTIPQPASFPTAYYMDNFRAFSSLADCVPEPSTLPLISLAALLACLYLRRKSHS